MIFTLAFFLVSCEKELDFKYHDVESQLVIEATLSETEATVSLTNTIPMGDPLVVNRLTDADVSIKDNTDNIIFQLSSDIEGFSMVKFPVFQDMNIS